jgi:hypothetical protein
MWLCCGSPSVFVFYPPLAKGDKGGFYKSVVKSPPLPLSRRVGLRAGRPPLSFDKPFGHELRAEWLRMVSLVEPFAKEGYKDIFVIIEPVTEGVHAEKKKDGVYPN